MFDTIMRLFHVSAPLTVPMETLINFKLDGLSSSGSER